MVYEHTIGVGGIKLVNDILPPSLAVMHAVTAVLQGGQVLCSVLCTFCLWTIPKTIVWYDTKPLLSSGWLIDWWLIDWLIGLFVVSTTLLLLAHHSSRVVLNSLACRMWHVLVGCFAWRRSLVCAVGKICVWQVGVFWWRWVGNNRWLCRRNSGGWTETCCSSSNLEEILGGVLRWRGARSYLFGPLP